MLFLENNNRLNNPEMKQAKAKILAIRIVMAQFYTPQKVHLCLISHLNFHFLAYLDPFS